MSPLGQLQDHLEQCCVEYVAQVNDRGVWSVYTNEPLTEDRIYTVDEDVVSGPVVLVRKSDGARFCVDVSVSVWEEPNP